jgi:hypothetical protein
MLNLDVNLIVEFGWLLVHNTDAQYAHDAQLVNCIVKSILIG